MVLGRARSGSTWLSECLASHPGVCIHDEPLNKESLPLAAAGEIAAYVASLLAPGGEPAPQAVGLKLLYDQLFLNERHPGFLLPYWGLDDVEQRDYLELRRRQVEGRLLAAWPGAYLRKELRRLRRAVVEDRGIRVVHIRRRSLLRAHLSLVVATRFTWVEAPRPEGPLLLDADRFGRAVSGTRRFEALVGRVFREHPCHEVFYEDLLADTPSQLDDLGRFLGLSGGRFSPSPPRVPRPLELDVANLDELRARFPGECD